MNFAFKNIITNGPMNQVLVWNNFIFFVETIKTILSNDFKELMQVFIMFINRLWINKNIINVDNVEVVKWVEDIIRNIKQLGHFLD